MSIDLSKIGYGVIVNPSGDDGIVISKIGYGAVLDVVTASGGVVVSKVGYGIIIDTAYTPPRRRGFMNFHP
jgi:hypothetical protein